MKKLFVLLLLVSSLSACKEDQAEKTDLGEAVRGLKTMVVANAKSFTERRFPSVLQPASVSSLSFEVSGKLKQITLDVGQHVKKGDVIAQLDPKTLDLKVENARAALDLSNANAENAADELKRQKQLLAKGAVTRVAVDDARTRALTTAATVTQSEKALASAEENLTKTVLRAPYDGVINTLEVDSFGTVNATTLIATIYSTDAFEVSFSVNFEVVNLLTVGKKAKVRLADNPSVVLDAVISELGSRADAVSSFPVVVTLVQSDATIKAGMAVEVTLEFAVEQGQGYTIPLSAAIKTGQLEHRDINYGQDKDRFNGRDPAPLKIYVYDPETSTVNVRHVMMNGISENSLLVVEGLDVGERVAIAGVSFLRDGQKVKLLLDSE
ncbi:MAG: efflux RND transporter periplasmic adaptor subunit [Proteobacteria bacterium]|nr:efflux RND transporter periplasmic adaptor subunit [Pseudomonadota bacterium]